MIDATVHPGGREATVVRRAGSGPDSALETSVRDAGYGAVLIPTATLKLSVKGLYCGGCEQRADRALRGVRGMRRVRVSRRSSSATVVYETKRSSPTQILTALRKAGFPARRG